MNHRGRVIALLALVALLTLWWKQRRPASTPWVRGQSRGAGVAASPRLPAGSDERTAAAAARPAPATRALDKAARVERTRADYDEMRTRVAAEYRAAGPAFPGGLNAFLRQLALLERERRRDLLTVLTQEELEALEVRDSHAGAVIRQGLDGTAATDAQRRAVFQLQQAFDDQYALTFDLSPPFLLRRERDRQQLQDRIRAVLGDGMFADWLRTEGTDYAAAVAFAARCHLDSGVAPSLRDLRNAYTLEQLEIAAASGLTPDQRAARRAASAREAAAKITALLGASTPDATEAGVVPWLPRSAGLPGRR